MLDVLKSFLVRPGVVNDEFVFGRACWWIQIKRLRLNNTFTYLTPYVIYSVYLFSCCDTAPDGCMDLLITDQ